ncbi:MAG: tRNA (adenosine(37)-N6)-threonylcarbamoyltransferase complex ATPase subunit type 1 TsaE [Patescibacteria group bacterium]
MEEAGNKEVKSLSELRDVAEKFLAMLNTTDASMETPATVIGLSGDLGSGKTAFVKCIASALGITNTVNSPTFILEKIYNIPKNPFFGDRFTKLIHIDAYRLTSGDEMKSLGWETLLKERENLIFLEWPEQVKSALPENIITLSFKHIDETTRCIEGLSF